jgi:phosphinothricin acetyltransferase
MATRAATADDAEVIAAIYNHYIAHTVITFEEALVDAAEMRSRIQSIQTEFPYLVHEDRSENNGAVTGFAYATQWRPRSAYRHAVETTIYLRPATGGRGIGSELYGALIKALREGGFHSAMAGIALPNPASVVLHKKLGFEKVAHFKQVGFKFEQWIDVGYWQLML